MRVISPAEIEVAAMELVGAKGVTMRVLIGPNEGAPTFVMRMFEIAPGGHTPMHAHKWEHEVFMLDGEGEIASPTQQLWTQARTAVFVAPGETHQFVNVGSGTLRFLCLIPAQEKACH
jgi:quercetin dioxygenase-like cupin family protein